MHAPPSPPAGTRRAPRVVGSMVAAVGIAVVAVAGVVDGTRPADEHAASVVIGPPGSPTAPPSLSSTSATVPRPPTSTTTAAVPSSSHSGPLSAADGVLPGGASIDATTPAVARLDPALRTALRRATAEAAGHGVVIRVTSGWRSPAYQEHLLREAIAERGSAAEAARWVATPETSAHVSSDAVDVGPEAATNWLSRFGARYGLCRVYANEPWHYELRAEAVRSGCPAMYPDPTHDPRMQR